MGHSIRYVRMMDSGFYRCLIYEVGAEKRKFFVLTYFDGRQNQFSFENVREFETEHADVDEQELWLCRVDSDNDFWNRITVKIPRSSLGKKMIIRREPCKTCLEKEPWRDRGFGIICVGCSVHHTQTTNGYYHSSNRKVRDVSIK